MSLKIRNITLKLLEFLALYLVAHLFFQRFQQRWEQNAPGAYGPHFQFSAATSKSADSGEKYDCEQYQKILKKKLPDIVGKVTSNKDMMIVVQTSSNIAGACCRCHPKGSDFIISRQLVPQGLPKQERDLEKDAFMPNERVHVISIIFLSNIIPG